MRVVHVTEFGGPEVLSVVETPAPQPGPDQVIVALTFADILFLDALIRSGGWATQHFARTPPFVPGTGGVGTVIAVGPGVEHTWLGRRVLAAAETGYAEQIAVHVGQLLPVPDEVDDQTAAALLHDGATAAALDRLGEPRRDQWVLVTAAAGGAGSQLVQLAAGAGARVIAAASTGDKRDFAKKLGAEITIDYTQPGWDDQVRTVTGGGVGLAYDGAGGGLATTTLSTVVDGGRLVTYGTTTGFASLDYDDITRRGIDIITPVTSGTLTDEHLPNAARALALGAEGRLRPVISAVYRLEHAADAHRDLEARKLVGKALLAIT
ncbi:NADPH2:quinone reductase [Streptomyces sp. 3213]|uniref:zinc-binding dehydrogenase n=1 Tax=Streptomyces sp. 3213.3 TaxID=1855348 RepID=UPI00089AE961|nr:zinc-binding dehydrogenase [Streptomyces sp. 3213.3]SEC32760.1 NADPH2:quinone reductase [Streptomyces sp. 3213] [Streptomyces sp. 3213.3]